MNSLLYSKESSFIFIIILFSLFFFDIGGRIYFFDIGIILFSIFYLKKENYEYDKILKYIIILSILFSINQLFQDLYTNTEIINIFKGIVKSNILILTYLFFYRYNQIIIINNNSNFDYYYILPIIFSLIAIYFIQPNIHAKDGDWWKFGLSIPISLACLFISSKLKILHSCVLIFLIAAKNFI
jgi:hypothetical protein